MSKNICTIQLATRVMVLMRIQDDFDADGIWSQCYTAAPGNSSEGRDITSKVKKLKQKGCAAAEVPLTDGSILLAEGCLPTYLPTKHCPNGNAQFTGFREQNTIFGLLEEHFSGKKSVKGGGGYPPNP